MEGNDSGSLCLEGEPSCPQPGLLRSACVIEPAATACVLRESSLDKCVSAFGVSADAVQLSRKVLFLVQ